MKRSLSLKRIQAALEHANRIARKTRGISRKQRIGKSMLRVGKTLELRLDAPSTPLRKLSKEDIEWNAYLRSRKDLRDVW